MAYIRERVYRGWLDISNGPEDRRVIAATGKLNGRTARILTDFNLTIADNAKFTDW